MAAKKCEKINVWKVCPVCHLSVSTSVYPRHLKDHSEPVRMRAPGGCSPSLREVRESVDPARLKALEQELEQAAQDRLDRLRKQLERRITEPIGAGESFPGRVEADRETLELEGTSDLVDGLAEGTEQNALDDTVADETVKQELKNQRKAERKRFEDWKNEKGAHADWARKETSKPVTESLRRKDKKKAREWRRKNRKKLEKANFEKVAPFKKPHLEHGERIEAWKLDWTPIDWRPWEAQAEAVDYRRGERIHNPYENTPKGCRKQRPVMGSDRQLEELQFQQSFKFPESLLPEVDSVCRRAGLTHRQRDVIAYTLQGLIQKLIARKMKLSVKSTSTISQHKKKAIQKLLKYKQELEDSDGTLNSMLMCLLKEEKCLWCHKFHPRQKGCGVVIGRGEVVGLTPGDYSKIKRSGLTWLKPDE